ncbi:hypothetical protein V496_07894 [Pseudogymnoascus sp. VKM F-4515 (FW-2607)]|nr:hypothetical protein V496_07894 [Pseudogymnoascus sp. VKM F-4515 (FW-2607)]KFY88297.1 hypothetical protein V498_06844 [Pseudogymnoascus sp. VKM F-4517 (FW-2822)]
MKLQRPAPPISMPYFDDEDSNLGKPRHSRRYAMGMEDSEPPVMSGGLEENATPSKSNIGPRRTHTSPQVGSKNDEVGLRSIIRRSTADGRRKSFHVASNSQRHGKDRGGPLERIEITPAPKATRLKKLKPRRTRTKSSVYPSSLDDLLRHAVNGPILLHPEANIPLPESDSEGSSGDENEQSHPLDIKWKGRSSLDDIIQNGNTFRHALPNMVPLPPSRPGSMLEAIARQPVPTQIPREPSIYSFNYPEMISRGSQLFKHFDKVLNGAPSRNNNIANITSVDCTEFVRRVPIEHVVGNNDQNNIRTLRALSKIPEGVLQRLLIVPDLSPQIINLLGGLFGLSPEVFEEHLINSGYNGAKYNDKPAHTWATAKMKKSHASIKWYRPVRRCDVAPYSKQELEVLLDPAQGRLNRDKGVAVYQTKSNIFRSEWEMWTDPKITTRDERVSGWEERATVWIQKLDFRDCYIVVLILDPLPIIEQGAERAAAVRAYRHNEDDSSSNTSTNDSSIDPREESKHLRWLTDIFRGQRTSRKQAAQIRRVQDPSDKDRKQDEEAGPVMSQSREIVAVKKLELLSANPVFEQIAPRARISIGLDEALRSPQLLHKLSSQLSQTTSTKDEFCQLLNFMPRPIKRGPHITCVAPLYQIIQQDSINLLDHLHTTLIEINADILSDSKMEDRVVIWRQIIARAQLELLELKQSITEFFSFTRLLDPKGTRIPAEVANLSAQIDHMIERLQTASSSLTSNMALLDSRRSIAEAQAVTKLTELAFFFIPLTFAATLFGMQVEQLATPVPISIFFAFGIGFIASSYLVRLTIRSAWLRQLIKDYKESIEMYAQNNRQPLKQGNVPASMFLRWAGHMTSHGVAVNFRVMLELIGSPRVGKAIIAAGLVSLVVVPLAVIWTKPMAPGIRAAITTVIVLFVVIMVVFGTMWRFIAGQRHLDDNSSVTDSI